jgi:hypothetical protein
MRGSKEPDIRTAYYAVAFMDLLGQQAAMRGLDRIPTTEDEKLRFVAAVEETAGVVDDHVKRARMRHTA